MRRSSTRETVVLNHIYLSGLLIKERSCKSYVVAAPHHAPIGQKHLPSEEHDVSDEGAGHVALDLAEKLDCHSIIAFNYFIDANKYECTDYFRRIEKWKPKILVEIHGHGPASTNFDIEISPGLCKNNKWSCQLAELLRYHFKKSKKLRKYSVSGDIHKIRLTAPESKTIVTDNWLPFHIELPKSIRASKREYSLFNKYLCKSLLTIRSEYEGAKKA